MAKSVYVGISDISYKGKKMYFGDGVARKVKKGYVGVPVVYTELEYIESSGTQYIDTGFMHNQNTRVVMDVQATDESNLSTSPWALGGRIAAYDASHDVFFYASSGQVWYSDYVTERTAHTGCSAFDRLLIDYDRNVCTINGVTVTHTETSFQSTCNLVLLARNTAGTIDRNLIGRLYSCKIYDNGTLVRDYVPCKNTSGVIGMFDKVNKQFCANAGTGTFTAGAELGVLVLDGIAKQFFSSETVVTYTGSHTITQVTNGGVTYNLMTMTNAGTLTVDGDPVQAWICGGGGTGATGTYNSGASTGTCGGGGGAGGYVASGTLQPGTYAVSIAAARGTSKIGSVLTANYGRSGSAHAGGSGGSGGGSSSVVSTNWTPAGGSGAGVSTYPFGITSLYAHCAGGGAGVCGSWSYDCGAGGTNGSNGGTPVKESSTSGLNGRPGSGGTRGGGKGGDRLSNQTGSAASFYGSGGGGGGSNTAAFTGGSGYQGVGYILWPVQ